MAGGSRTATDQIESQPLSDSSFLTRLASFRQVVQSSYGPTGRLKFLQNCCGGHVTVTSTSSRLLHGLSCEDHPVMRLIVAAINSHLDLFNDGGLMAAILLLGLIETSVELDIPRCVIVQVNSHAMQVISEHMNSSSCPWKLNIDLGNVDSMLSLVRSVVMSKPACCLADSDVEFITILLLKAFLQSLPSSTQVIKPSPVNFVVCEGSPTTESRVVHGVLLEAPSLASSDQTDWLKCRNIKVAVYNISMAGDSEEFFSDVKFEAVVRGLDTSVTDGMLRLMSSVVDKLSALEVGLVACQKCIHPMLKQNLTDKGMIVIDRLSILHIGSVQRVTGAAVQSTFTTDINEASLGSISKLEHFVFNGKRFLHMLPGESDGAKQVTTVVLCSPDETRLEELKCVSNAAVSVLSCTLACPYVLPGGGCTDTHLAALLRQKAGTCDGETLQQLGCTKGQYSTVMNNVASCLESVARSLEHSGGGHVIDLANQHHWSIPPNMEPSVDVLIGCCCGLVAADTEMQWRFMGLEQMQAQENPQFASGKNSKVDFRNRVLDSLTLKLNAFRVAFETANRILRVNYLLYDT